MAGIPGRAVVRLPFGLCIKRSALIRAFLLFSLSFSFYKGMHLLLMMGGNDLWNAIAPFLILRGQGESSLRKFVFDSGWDGLSEARYSFLNGL